MAGRLVNLGRPGIALPNRIIVDTSLLVARFLAFYLPPHLEAAARARQFFDLLTNQGTTGLLPAVVVQELFHVAIRGLYRRAVPSHQAELAAAIPTRRRFDWDDLYKRRPDLLESFLPELNQLLRLLEVRGLVVLQPDHLNPSSTGGQFGEDLLMAVGRYHLDSADALLVLEAERAGISAVATLDADLRRAQVDFDVYTWL